MGIKNSILAILKNPLLLAILACCFLLAVLFVILYFRVLRPRRGTMEWMKKVDRPEYQPLGREKLTWHDGPWLLLAAVCAAMLRFAYFFFWLRLPQRENLFSILLASAGMLIPRLLLAAALGGGLYLLLRILFGKPLPALCVAILSGLVVRLYTDTLLFLCFSLLFLYLWLSGDEKKGFFPGALWFLAAGACYALALLSCFRCIWLLPLFAGFYVCKQVRRLRLGNEDTKVGRVCLSLFLSLLCLVVGAFALYVLYALMSGQVRSLPEALRRLEFYGRFFPVLLERFAALFRERMAFTQTIGVEDAIVFMAGALALIPLCHGAVGEKNSRCVWLLVLVLAFGCQWLLTGEYLLVLPLFLVLGYEWSTFARRDKGYLAMLHALSLGSSFAVLLWI